MALHNIIRRKSVAVKVGNITVGGDASIVVQSMTNTDTEDAKATAKQIKLLADAGSELVRLTVNTEEAAKQVPYIKELLLKENCNVPLIGDFHYNGHRILSKYEDCAKTLDKFRINPGNVGFGNKRDSQFAMMVEAAIKYNKPVRIGVNWGSLDQDLLTHMMDENSKQAHPKDADDVMREAIIISALANAEVAENMGLARDKIILACKVSRVQDLVLIYQELAKRSNHALHLGLTEAGMGSKGIVATTAAMSILLQQGIGDTIRASLTPEPGGDRRKEVLVCQEILQSMGIRSFTPQVSACPGCGRTTSTYYQELADKIQHFLRDQMPVWQQQYPGVESMQVAVMGCIVNGPGESKHADIGISLPGSGEKPVAPVFQDGEKTATLRGENIAEEFMEILNNYVQQKYGEEAIA